MQLTFSGQHFPPCICFRCLVVKHIQRTLHAAITPSSLTGFLHWPTFLELSTQAPSTTAPVLTHFYLAADLSRVMTLCPCVCLTCVASYKRSSVRGVSVATATRTVQSLCCSYCVWKP